MTRNVPTGTALSRPFWEAASHGRLVCCGCDACGSRFFNPEPICPACGSDGWSWVESPGVGVVYSYTIVHRSPIPELEAPYVLAIVDLDDGWTMLTQVLGDPDDMAIGARVRVSFTPVAGAGSSLIPTFARTLTAGPDVGRPSDGR
ncbi:MAG: Zn-ribbon domain-containing OB-fold protein [Acidimicrobiia bacterium]